MTIRQNILKQFYKGVAEEKEEEKVEEKAEEKVEEKVEEEKEEEKVAPAAPVKEQLPIRDEL